LVTAWSCVWEWQISVWTAFFPDRQMIPPQKKPIFLKKEEKEKKKKAS
jgi:hypothetical protein